MVDEAVSLLPRKAHGQGLYVAAGTYEFVDDIGLSSKSSATSATEETAGRPTALWRRVLALWSQGSQGSGLQGRDERSATTV